MTQASTFPFKAWVLAADFTPSQVTVVGRRGGLMFITDTGQYLKRSRVFDTRKAAITWGRTTLDAWALEVHQKVNEIARLRANLEKNT